MAACRRPLYFCPVSFLLLSSPNLSGQRLDVCHTSTHDAALVRNLECMSEMCCTRLAEDTGRKNYAKNRHLRTIEQICRTISLQLRHILAIGKTLLNGNISSIYLYNMVNFGSLTAEIHWRVWGTPANFNEFRVLASLLHRRRSTEVNQTLHHVWPSLHW